jgi:hypothetical protein
MSRTTGIQNYLTNVFRPVYEYDTTSSNLIFSVKLEMSNIDTYSGNVVSVFKANVGDSQNNVYVGSNAGNPFTTVRACRNVTALGYGAANNISNDSNSVYIGYYAGSSGSNATDVIAIGTNSGGNGSSNIFLGTSTGTVGESNILIGHYIVPGNVSSQIRIGYRNQVPLAGDLSRNWIGVGGVLTPTTNTNFDVSGNAQISGTAKAAGGYISSNGTIEGTGSANTIIGTLKKGIVFVSVQDVSTTATHFASSMVYCSDPTNGTNVFDMSGSRVNQGDVTLNYNSSNIRFSNAGATRNFLWSIAYLPIA